MGTGGNEDANFFIGANHYGANMYMTTQVPSDGSQNQPYKSSEFSPERDKWYKVVFHAKMNSVGGAKDGIFQLWVDDVLLINANNVMYRRTGQNTGFRGFQMTPVYGGGKEEIPAEQYMYFDHVIVQATPFSGSGESRSIEPSKVPYPPPETEKKGQQVYVNDISDTDYRVQKTSS